jgi:hypothetical protein
VIEGRRSKRVLARIPIRLTVGQDPPQRGLTAVVNRHGALVLSPIPYEESTIVWIRNELTSETTCCLVVWAGAVDTDGTHKLGVEFVDEAPTFWGSAYEEAVIACRRE